MARRRDFLRLSHGWLFSHIPLNITLKKNHFPFTFGVITVNMISMYKKRGNIK